MKIGVKVKRTAAELIFNFIKSIKIIFSMPEGTCRHIPTCSEYSRLSIEKYPIHIAIKKISIRLLKCNPFSEGGYDPVDKQEIK